MDLNNLKDIDINKLEELNKLAIQKGYYLSQSMISGKYFLYKGDYKNRSTAYELVYRVTKSYDAMKRYIEKLKGDK